MFYYMFNLRRKNVKHLYTLHLAKGSQCLRLQELDHRISNLTRVPVSHNEEVQVLRYRTGEFYAAHNDNFDPAFYQTSVEP